MQEIADFSINLAPTCYFFPRCFQALQSTPLHFNVNNNSVRTAGCSGNAPFCATNLSLLPHRWQPVRRRVFSQNRVYVVFLTICHGRMSIDRLSSTGRLLLLPSKALAWLLVLVGCRLISSRQCVGVDWVWWGEGLGCRRDPLV